MSDNRPTPEQVREMSGPELVAVYNRLSPDKPVRRFASRSAGVTRLLDLLDRPEAIGRVEPAREARALRRKPRPAPTKPEEPSQPGTAAAGSGRGARLSYAPAPAADRKPPRPRSKRAAALAMLARPEGTTREQLAETFGWKPNDVRDLLRLVNKVNGYGVREDDLGGLHLVE